MSIVKVLASGEHFPLLKDLFILTYVLYHVHTWCPQMPEGGINSPEAGVSDGSKAPCVC